MPRYFRRPTVKQSLTVRAFHAGDDVWVDSMRPDIHVPDHEATDTGLLDANGDTIWRAPREMGFGRDVS